MSELRVEVPVDVTLGDDSKLREGLNKLKLTAEVEVTAKDIRSLTSSVNKQLGQGIPLKYYLDDSQKQTKIGTEALRAQEQLNKSIKEGNRLQKEAVQLEKNKGVAARGTAKIQATIDQKLARIQWLRENYTRALKDSSWAAELDRIEDGFRLGGTADDIQVLSKNLSTLEMRARAAGNAGKTFGDRFKDATAKFGNWFTVSQAFMWVVEQGQKVVANVKAIDTAMTDLQKVSDASSASYDKYLQSAARRSAAMGTKLTDYIEGTNQFARLGYGIEEAQKLGEVANIYAQVGDDIAGIEDATSSIVSTMKAFNIDAEEAIRIVDVYNKLGNEFAVSSGNVGAILQRSASSLAAAGNSFEQTAAMGVGMSEITQDAEGAGNALKVVSLRIRGKYVPPIIAI